MSDFVKITEQGIIKFASNNEQNIEDVGIWSILRDECRMDPDITLGDLFWIIENNEELLELVETLYPYVNFKSNGFVSREIQIGRDFRLSNAKILGFPKFTGNVSNYDPNSPLILDLNTKIYKEKEIVGGGNDCLSLLEFLECVFLGSCEDRQELVLTKNGLTSVFYEDPYEPWDYLMHPCRVAEEVTLGDVFSFVEKHELLKVFLSFYSWCNDIDAFHKLAKKEGQSDDLFYLEVYKQMYLKKGYFHLSNEFHGIGPVLCPEIYSESIPDFEKYGLSLTPVYKIAKTPIRLLETIKIPKLGSFAIDYTLLDILDAIYNEISFHGGPEEAQEVAEELIDRKKKVEDLLRDGDTKNPPPS